MKGYLDENCEILPGINWWTINFGIDNEDGVNFIDKYRAVYKDEVFFFEVWKTAPHMAQVRELAKRKVRVDKNTVGWRICYRNGMAHRTASPKILTKEENKEGMWVQSQSDGKLIIFKDYPFLCYRLETDEELNTIWIL